MKSIPALLLTHKAQQVTTMCRLLKVRCKDGTLFGFANLDIDVLYDDDRGTGESPSDGPILYRAAQGFTPSRIAFAAGTSVDNADLDGLTADLEAIGLTAQQILAGKLDYADAWVYEINYEDLTSGRHDIVARGKLGRSTVRGDTFRNELRSLLQLLKQSLGKVVSLTCRAQFGDAQCGKPITWVAGSIDVVSGTEPDRIIEDTALLQAADYFVPGVMRVITGANEGFEVEIESFSAGVITLSMPAPFPFAPGDLFDIAQNCSKVWGDADHGCLHHWGAFRALHFRGEHLTPVGQEGALSTPGAEI